ncbi:MAG: ABC transporter permease, partial [Bacteroidota bacterium]
MDKIIEWYCTKSLLEDLQGDLHEYYARNIKKGPFKADMIFLLDVIKFCRIYTIQKPKILGQMTFFNLMGNYFKTSVRSLARNRLFSSINIIGLSIAMSIGILMITYVSHLLSFDNFHEKKDRLFKLQTIYMDATDGDIIDLYSTSVFMADKLKEDYPGVEQVLLMQGSANKDFTYDEKTLQLKGKYASKEFFNMLSYKLVAGDPNTALENPYSIVLTKSAAQKFFEEENPLGKTFQSEENTYTITGLMEDPPLNAHLGKFEMLESFSTRREEEKENKGFGNWNNIWMYHAYLLLNENSSSESIERHLNDISKEENA